MIAWFLLTLLMEPTVSSGNERSERDVVVDMMFRPVAPIANVYMEEAIKPMMKMVVQGMIDKNKAAPKKKRGLFGIRRN